MRSSLVKFNYLRFLWGAIAFSVYFTLLALLFYYFNHRHIDKPKHFVKKDEKRVVLASVIPQKLIKIKTIEVKAKSKPKKQVKKIKPPESKPEIIKKPKITSPKKKVVIKEKIVKKIKPKKKDKKHVKSIKRKPKIINKPKQKVRKVDNKPKEPKKTKVEKTSDLFSSVKTKKIETKKIVKHKIITKKQPILVNKKISETVKTNKASDSGIENAYFTKVQNLLETWPAQSEYAGEKATVRLYVKPTGLFEFKVKSQSDNIEFNAGLVTFLKQLQKLGFGVHKGGKTYEFDVEFIAKE